jgi:hypothetical protein
MATSPVQPLANETPRIGASNDLHKQLRCQLQAFGERHWHGPVPHEAVLLKVFGDAVSSEYKTPGKFLGGTIQGAGVTVEKAAYADLELEAKRALLRE